MNFLAHLYLSGNNNEIKIGNFIGDAVKGNSHQNYSPKIQKGILIHRKIDEYTDKHQITKDLSSLFKKKYLRHSGIVIDMIYDHFLSQNWTKYSKVPLNTFINSCYRVLMRNFLILPLQVKQFLPIMITNNRLLSYSKIEGIEKSLEIMSKYTSLPAESGYAMEVLNDNYQHINVEFQSFFNDLIIHVEKEMEYYKV